MAHSVKVNYVLNLINTGTQMLFPLITFPYACRIIQPEGIGQINFFSSIISYISLFTCLGIPLYAIREIARCRNNIVQMNRTAVEILLLHTLLTFFGYVVVAILCFAVPEIKESVPLFLVLSLTILFTAIGCEWFYQGMEDFLYITIRGLVVKVVSVIFLFLFVKTKDDLILYAWYAVLGALGGNVFNFFRLRKYIHRGNIIFSQLNIRRHIKPAFKVFTFSIVTSLYLHLNSVLLGFMKGALAVGYFAAANKLMGMLMRLSSCLGSVMIPRVSNLIAEKRMDEFRSLVQKSYDFTIGITLPLMVALICCAPYVISVLCGDKFLPSTLASQIVAPIIVMVGMSGVFGMQVLYPMGKINIVIKCCLIGAITNIIVNIALIPHFSYNGTAVAYLSAEVATTLSMYLIARKDLPIKYLCRNHWAYVLGCVVMAAVLLLIPEVLNTSGLTILICQILLGVLSYFLVLLAFHDQFVVQILQKVGIRL